VRVLLDTNVAIWMATQPDHMSPEAVDLVLADSSVLVLSAVTPWEIAIKWRTGKLTLPEHPREWTARMAGEFGVEALPVSRTHAVGVADLPDHHSDPFDRLLIAQAQVEQIPVLTGDRVFSSYDLDVIAAR
jgi:PIN domain nuclease of toxin-antitoxin system